MAYKTDDIAVASALRSYGHKITEIEVHGRRATFIFDSSVEDEAMQIQVGKKLVDALLFHEQLRRLSGLARSMSTQANSTILKASD